MREVVGTLPAPLVAVPGVAGIYQRITVTNGAGGATLISLLSGGVLPQAPVPNTNAGARYVFGGVDMQSETDPSTIGVRYIDNGSDAPTGTLGFLLPSGAGWLRVITDLANIKLISTGADVKVQVRLLVTSTEKI
jgi:hypothetical protein